MNKITFDGMTIESEGNIVVKGTDNTIFIEDTIRMNGNVTLGGLKIHSEPDLKLIAGEGEIRIINCEFFDAEGFKLIGEEQIENPAKAEIYGPKWISK